MPGPPVPPVARAFLPVRCGRAFLPGPRGGANGPTRLRIGPGPRTLGAMKTDSSPPDVPGSPSRPGLVRALGLLMATAVVVGTVIGSGVFRKPHDVSKYIDSHGLTF